MQLTRQQAIAEHRKMWNWIASEIRCRKEMCDIWKLKSEYILTKHIIGIMHVCFLCEYAKEKGKENCNKCPIDWKSNVKSYMCENIDDHDEKGLYRRCCHSTNWREQAELAEEIAELPEMEDV